MRVILESTNHVVNNYGISIIILSIIVNTVLIPLYLFAERIQEKELNIRKHMQPRIDEFKRAFSGYERFAYIKALYRIHRYHPITGLRTIIGLVIQVPFFIAAYHLLKHYAPLSGTGFGVIHDMSQQDALLRIGSITVNVLPIIMTILNIVGGSIYVQRKHPQAITQILGMSMVFLVLLYHAPSGLVLYWTMNNVYSLVKNIVLSKKEHTYAGFFQEIAYTCATLRTQWVTLYRNTIKIRNIIVCVWGVSWYVLLAYVLYEKNRIGGAMPLKLLYTSWGMSIVVLVGMLYIIQIHLRTRSLKGVLLGVIGVYVASAVALILYHAYIPYHTVTAQQKMITLQNIGMTIAGLGISTLLLPLVIRYGNNKAIVPTNIQRSAKPKGMGVMVLVYIVIAMFIIGVVTPLEIFNSDPFVFEGFVMKDFFAITLKWCIVISGIVYGLYYLVPRTYKPLYAGFMIASVLMICINAYIVPFRYGLLNQFQFDNPDHLLTSYPWYIIEGIGVMLLCYWVYMYLIHNTWLLRSLSVLLIITVASKGTIAAITYNTDVRRVLQAHTEGVINTPVSDSDTFFDKPKNQLLDFSRTGNNVLVLILDAFPGGYIAPILEEFPALKETFDGFVWYPNTLTAAYTTAWSLPLLIGGITWSIPASAGNSKSLEQFKYIHQIIEYLPTLYDELLGFYGNQDYAISLASLGGQTYYDCNTGIQRLQTMTNKHVDLRCNKIDSTYSNYWLKNQQNTSIPLLITHQEKAKLLTAIGIFRSLPVMAKYWWYKRGRWIFGIDTGAWQLNSWAFLNTMEELSRVTEDTGNTFKLFHNEITHFPFVLDNTCNKAPEESKQLNGRGIRRYNTARCTLHLLGEYITWLKKHNIYDNTKIILISDHGAGSPGIPSDSKNDNVYYEKYSSLTKNYGDAFDPQTIGFRHALLFVKEYHAKGIVKTDTRFMSNADLRSILCGEGNAEFTEYCTTESNPIHIEPPLDRTLYTHSINTEYPRIFKVQHNIFDPENWTEVPLVNK